MEHITDVQVFCLDQEVEGSAAERPLLWLTAVSLSYIWERRKQRKAVIYIDCRAEIIAQAKIMEKTDQHNESLVLNDLIENYFQ